MVVDAQVLESVGRSHRSVDAKFPEIQIAEPCAREDARYLEQSERGNRDERVSTRKRRPIRTM